jgi:YidC/Oxa1 family membrane protein insertase
MFHTIFYLPLYNALIAITGLFGGSLGFGVAGLTLLVKLILSPLSYQSTISQIEQKKLLPYISDIKKKYPDQKEQAAKLNELYKEHKTHPLSGCLLLLLQLPVLFAIFYVFKSGSVVNPADLYSFVDLPGAKSVDEITVILDSARDSMSETLDYKETAKSLSVEESLRSFDDCITVLENKKPGIQGWITGFSLLDTKLSGVPKPVGFDEHGNKIPIPGSSFGFAGAPQHGKSTILQNIILNIAKRNEDVVVLYWCLDDSRQRVTERLLAMDSKVNWNKITRRVPITEDEKKEVEKSITTLKELVSSGRFVMKDQSNGNTLSFLFKWVEMTKEMTDKPILVCIDSFHKIVSKVESGGNDYTAVKKNSQDLKKFIQSHCVTILASLELNKTAARGLEPDLMSITEARKIEYDFDIIATVYNNYYDMDGESTQVITKPTGERSPLIKFNLRKTKDGGSGPVYFALDTGNFSITDYSVDDISNLTNHEPIRPVTNGEIRIVPHDVGGLKPILTPVGRRYKKSGDDKSAAEPWHKS